MTFHLRQIEIWSAAFGDQPFRIVKKVEPKIEERSGYRSSVNFEVLLKKMPAARPHDQGRNLLFESILLPFRACEVDPPVHGVSQVRLTVQVVLPGWGVGVLEVGHEHICAGVQSVNDHL